MEFIQDKPHRRISGKGILVLLQDGHVFSSKDVYVGPEPKGSGSLSPKQILEEASKGPKAEKPKAKKEVKPKVEMKPKVGLFLAEKPKRKAIKRFVGKK